MSKPDAEELLQGCPENIYLEKLLSLRTSRPKDWNLLSPSSKLAALNYEAQRRKAAEERSAQP